jgi:hypothetical protein
MLCAAKKTYALRCKHMQKNKKTFAENQEFTFYL